MASLPPLLCSGFKESMRENRAHRISHTLSCPALAQVVTEGFQAVRRSELALPRYLHYKNNVG